jgi:uncharacterized protein
LWPFHSTKAGTATLAATIAGAALTGYLFDLAHVPVGWLLGPMVAGIAVSAWRGKPQSIHPGFMTVGQVVLGLSIGVGFPLATLVAAATHAVPLLLAVVITGGLSLLNGLVLWRWGGVDRATGFLGSLPGAASAMVAMSDETGADAVAVAVLQYLRLMLVVLLAPAAVHYLFPDGGSSVGSTTAAAAGALPTAPWAVNLAVLAMLGLLGARGGRKVKLPSPTFLGPCLAALLASWTLPYTWQVPDPLFQAGMLAVGLTIGSRFDVPMARKLGRAALVEAGLVTVLIGLCLVVGWGFHAWTGVDALTAVLGSTPGGMEVMVASAMELGGDPGMVLAMQMTRWLLVLIAGPWVAVRVAERGKRAA